MSLTSSQLTELSTIGQQIIGISSIISAEGSITPSDRLIASGSVTDLNTALFNLLDYYLTLIPSPL